MKPKSLMEVPSHTDLMGLWSKLGLGSSGPGPRDGTICAAVGNTVLFVNLPFCASYWP